MMPAPLLAAVDVGAGAATAGPDASPGAGLSGSALWAMVGAAVLVVLTAALAIGALIRRRRAERPPAPARALPTIPVHRPAPAAPARPVVPRRRRPAPPVRVSLSPQTRPIAARRRPVSDEHPTGPLPIRGPGSRTTGPPAPPLGP